MEDGLHWLHGLAKFPKLPRPLQVNVILRLASFTLLFATIILFLLVGLSLTFIKSIIIIKVSALNSVDPVSHAITNLYFGVWGACATR